VRIIVPWNSGGPNDLIARTLATSMAQTLKQNVVIENRAGANGVIGSNAVAKGAKDGSTLLITSSAHTLNAVLYRSLPFDPMTDFAPVSLIATTPGNVLVVRKDFPAADLAGFIDYVRRAPNGVTYATNGLGNGSHIIGELFAKSAALKMEPVHYKGTAPFVTDILGGHIPAGFMSPVAAVPLIKGGEMRALAVSGEQRLPALPDVPTFAEHGIAGVDLGVFYGAWFAAGTPADRIDIMNRALVAAMNSAEFRKLAADSNIRIVASSPADFAAYLAKDIVEVERVAAKVNLPKFD